MATTKYPTKQWIKERFDFWREKMLLLHWDIDLCIEDDKSVDDDGNVGNAAAKPHYLMGTVTVARKQSKIVVDSVIVHELGHFITSDFLRKARKIVDMTCSAELKKVMLSTVSDMNETLVSHVANMLMEMYGEK